MAGPDAELPVRDADATAEVTGLISAQQFAAGMAAAHTGAIAGAEAFRASVTGCGVTGDVVAAADHAVEAQTDAAASWERAHAALLEQNPVAEAYAAAPDAGSKEFLTDAGGAPVGGVPSARPSSLPEDRVTQPPLPDPLRLAGRFHLEPGEQFAGSGSLKDREGSTLLAAAVDTPDGRQIHVGVPIYDENKKNWRGAHAPAEETEVDEEEEFSVDTGADTTVILDAADAARFGEAVDDVVARATAVDKDYRLIIKDVERLYDERSELESRRFGGAGYQKMDLDARLKQHEKYQKSRRATMDDAAACLPAADRAEYDAIQAQLDAGGYDRWEPGQEDQAAAACGLSRAEFDEMMALKRIPDRQLTGEQSDRLRELAPYFVPPSPLHERQQALICGLTVEEFRELQALEKIPKRKRYPSQQARIDELDNSPRGATAGSPKKTRRMRGLYCSYQEAHHSVKAEYAGTLDNLAALEATARPLDAADAARLAQVTADLDTAYQQSDALGGEVTASAEFPGRNGDALVLEALQREEDGGVDYRLDYKPADADDDWTAGNTGDPYTTTPGGLRKIAALIGKLAGGE